MVSSVWEALSGHRGDNVIDPSFDVTAVLQHACATARGQGMAPKAMRIRKLLNCC
jgi:hypothetical protein